MRCRDLDYIVNSMNEAMKNGYRAEHDMFVARAQLELMARCETPDLSKKLRSYYPDMKSPLLNFIDMLYEIILIKDFQLFKDVLVKYDAQIKRDPQLMAVSIMKALFIAVL